MAIVRAMTGFGGRIDRRTYWLASLVLLLFALVALAGLVAVFVALTVAGQPHGVPLSKAYGLTLGETRTFMAYGWLATLPLLYPTAAITARRLHDFGWSGWWSVVPVVVLLTDSLVVASGYGGTLLEPNTAADVMSWANIVLTVTLIAVAGLLPGTKGPNQYGPDPKAEPAGAPQARVASA